MDTSSPDVLAAAYDPSGPPAVVGDLTGDHEGSVIRILGKAMTLLEVLDRPAPDVNLLVRIDGNPFESALSFPAATPCEMVTPSTRTTDMVDMTDFEEQARELDRIARLIVAREAELPVLKERKRELADRLLERMAALGEKRIRFDDRVAFLFPEMYPAFEQREDGTKYTMRDLAPVLREEGYAGAIKPEEAGFKALLKIFRDHAKAEKPLPPKIAAMVRPETVYTVRVGPGKAGRTK